MTDENNDQINSVDCSANGYHAFWHGRMVYENGRVKRFKTPNITTRSGRTGRWTKMPRSFVLFSGSGPSHHRLFSAGFIVDTFGFRFSVHTDVSLLH